MLRKTLVSIAVSTALYVSSSYALELGELTSQSNLNEPYRGKIELSDVGVLTSNDILIRLGSESEFRQAGFMPTRVLSQLKFDVVRENTSLIVAIASDQPLLVDELRFILAARWPSGQVVREYKAPLNQSALVSKSQSEVVQSSSLAPTQSTAINESVFAQSRMSAQGMPIKGRQSVVKGNTLWSVAGQNKPANQLTIYQTMMAIQALNREAFYSDNINLLKEGAVLRLPTQEQVSLFNEAISKAEFQRQHDAWMALKSSRQGAGVDQAQLNTQAKSKSASNTPNDNGDKLTLASGQSLLPEDSASSNVGESEGSMSALQSELSASKEMLDKEQREKNELSSQLGELNKQLETLEQLISLKDKQMAELQQQFTSAQQSLQEQKNTVDQLLEADQIRREKEQAEADSLTNQIFGNPIIVSIGAVIILMLGFLIGLVMRRGGKKQEAQDSPKKDEFDLSAAAPIAALAATDALSAESEEQNQEEDPFAFDFDAPENGDFDAFGSLDEDVSSSEESVKAEALSSDALNGIDSTVDDDVEDIFASFSDAEAEDDGDELDVELGEEDELEAFVEEDIPTMAPDTYLADDLAVGDDADSEEASFVSSLLNDVEQDDVDESSVFKGSPSDSLANSIEESLAEAQQEDLLETPAFGEAEAAQDEVESDEEEEFDFFDASGDEVATKLDLARAYMDMGDEEGARVILDDVVGSGNEQQIAEAKSMMERMFPSD
ncbi:FimV/HubP family polar landmark protein [Marinomonas sp. IMCC 4694]|uniref:FimV/HubP family polar landmark protein n=1 Tax=Marinomonas sp. IMCC 4694 TaxID=2605432 RepID=UPI0011E7BE10|nr:FimV/HubP family polar landmark protein [Marinomonas sp. IMCC 4694]TYL47949.1 pilus assembly protein FimV [Marinomonas sp. IMCC 4694]